MADRTAPKTSSLGKVELTVLRYVTEHQPVSVREVARHFARTKGDARTTTLTVMERLRQKGFLTRKKIDGVFHYAPRVPLARLLRTMVREFIDRALGGSLAPFMAYLSRDARMTREELDELRRLVRDLEKRREAER